MKYTSALVVLLALPAATWPQQAGPGRRLYLLTASPTIYGPVTYPADLYTIGEDNKLQLVRHVVPAEDGVDFVLGSPNALVVAHPHISPTALEIIHFDDPGSVDTIKPSLGQRSVVGGFMVDLPSHTIIALDLASPPEQTPFQLSLMGIDLRKSDSGQRITDHLPWDTVEYARAQGEAGGPLEGRSPHLAGTLPKDGGGALEGHVTALLCANDRFSVFAESAATFEETLKRTSSGVVVADRQLETSRKITIRGSQSRYRLFGSWLAVLIVEPATGHTVNPGTELQRKKATATLPSVTEAYDHAMGIEGKWLPGILELINLESGNVIQWNTGQSDSEILDVSGDEVLYRVNYQIFTASVTGGQLDKSVLVAEDKNVPEVHWVFWSAK
jgi:hypothetical protein